MSDVQLSTETQMLLSALWRGGAHSYYWTPDGPGYFHKASQRHIEKSKVSLWFPLSAIPTSIPGWDTKNVYFAVHPSASPRERWERSVITSVSAVNALYADYDVIDFGGFQGLHTHIATLPFQPTFTVNSGGGLHCYWILTDTVHATAETLHPLIRMQSAWVDLVRSDAGVKDLARVLRLPGWRNMKAKYAPNFPLVEFVEVAPARRYTLTQLTEWCAPRIAEIEEAERAQAASDATRSGAANPGAAKVLVDACIPLAETGSRHSLALWLAHKLKDEGIIRMVTLENLRYFAKAVSTPGTRPLEDDEMKRIVAAVYGGSRDSD